VRLDLTDTSALDPVLGAYLATVPLFARLSERERAKIGGAFQLEHYRDGEKIIRQGERGDAFFLLKEGKARVVREQSKGKELEIDEIGQGDHFGEAALLNDAPRGASIVSLGRSEVLRLDRKHFTTLFSDKGALRNVMFAKRAGVGVVQGDKPSKSSSKLSKAVSLEVHAPGHEEEDHEPHFGSMAPGIGRKREKTEKQRQLIYKAIKDNVLFTGMAYKGVLKVISTMWKLEVPKGEIIVRQGEVGDNFYVIEKGKVHVLVRNPDGKGDKKVDKVKAKSCFGHVALMYDTPRNATILAAAKSVLWAVDRFTFRRVLRNMSAQKLKQYEEFLKCVPLLAPLTAAERSKIAEAIDEVKYEPGEDIVTQAGWEGEAGAGGDSGHGTDASAMYILLTGKAKVMRTVAGQTHEVKRLGRGDAFGELSLIKKQPRSATVTCLNQVECLRLDANSFYLLLGPLEEILKKRAQSYERLDTMSSADRQTFDLQQEQVPDCVPFFFCPSIYRTS
jgi:cAMP-dependent protein kinase regulator